MVETPDSSRYRLARAASGVVWTVVFAVLVFVLGQLFGWLFASLDPPPLLLSVLSLLSAAVAAGTVLPVPWGIQRWTGAALAPRVRPAMHETAIGLAIGCGAAALAIAPGLALGWTELKLDPHEEWSHAAGPGVGALLTAGAVGEELTLRGYGFQQLSRAVTPPGAAVGGAVVFALLHRGNPGSTTLSAVNTALFGILFGVAVWRHRSLLVAVGMHLGWNLTLATLGAPISGLTMRVTSLVIVPAAPEMWSGGSYGPEATLPATVAVFVALAAVWKIPVLAPGRRLIWDDARFELDEAVDERRS